MYFPAQQVSKHADPDAVVKVKTKTNQPYIAGIETVFNKFYGKPPTLQIKRNTFTFAT
jgi:hypothetical protein